MIWRSLRWRFVGSYLVLALVLLVFAGYIFANALRLSASIVQRQQLMSYVDQAQSVLSTGSAQGWSASEALQQLREALPALQVQQLAGVSVGRVIDKLPVQPLPVPSKQVLLLGKGPYGDESFDLLYTPSGLKAAGFHFALRVGPATALTALYRQVLAVLGLALALAGLAGWLLSRWLAGPLARLDSATEAVARGDFLQTVEPTGIVELDRVTNQFNRMVLRLRESFRSLAAERDLARRFAADAAHELKTPVTTLRAYHEVVEEHPERLPQLAPAVGRQIGRMERVIAGLLELARLGEGTGMSLEPGDAGAVLRELEPLYQALAEEHGHRLTVAGIGAPVPVLLDRRLLETAVSNLMDNACKYTPSGGYVALLLERDGDEAVISVCDNGQGIAPAELPYIFERFHRGLDTQSLPGTGLGLAITREAVRLMGGDVTVASAPSAGSRFMIRLPLLR